MNLPELLRELGIHFTQAGEWLKVGLQFVLGGFLPPPATRLLMVWSETLKLGAWSLAKALALSPCGFLNSLTSHSISDRLILVIGLSSPYRIVPFLNLSLVFAALVSQRRF